MSTTTGKEKENINPNPKGPSPRPDQKRTAAWGERSPLQQLDQKRSTTRSLVESVATFFSSLSSSFLSPSPKQQPLEQEMRVMSSLPATTRDVSHQENAEVNRHLGHARYYLEHGKYKEALEVTKKAYQKAPANGVIHNTLGSIYATTKKEDPQYKEHREKAYYHLLEAYLLEPKNERFKANFNAIASFTKKPNSASEEITKRLQDLQEESDDDFRISSPQSPRGFS